MFTFELPEDKTEEKKRGEMNKRRVMGGVEKREGRKNEGQEETEKK